MADRTPSGHFKLGHSVKGGRTPGPSRAERIARRLEPHLEDTLKKLAELAKAGDPRSAELLLRYVAPPPKDAERVRVPGLSDAPTLRGKAELIVDAVAAGAVTVEAGQRLLAVIADLGRVIALDDLEKRIKALEQPRTPLLVAGSAEGDRCDPVEAH